MQVISKTIIAPQYYVSLFERLYKLHKDIKSKFIDSLAKRKKHDHSPIKPPKFDVNEFLQVFDLIKVDEGYTLKYKYCGDQPYVYTRRKSFISNLFSSNANDTNDASDHYSSGGIKNISFEQTPEGFFQFAVFSVAVHQFYLYWHALTNDTVFVYSRQQIENILKSILEEEYEYAIRYEDIHHDLSSADRKKLVDAKVLALFQNRKSNDDISIFLGPIIEEEQDYWTTKEELEALFNASIDPEVTIMKNGDGVVRMLTFSKWYGFIYYRYDIKWPNSIEKTHGEFDKRVLKYDCGIQF